MDGQTLLSQRSRNHYRQIFRSFCRWLVRDRRLPVDPVLGLQNEKVVQERHARTELTSKEFGKLIETAQKSDRKIEGLSGEERCRLYHLAFLTGLRKKEIAMLTKRSFALTVKTPTVTIEASEAKAKRRDVLPLHPALVEMLRPCVGKLHNGEPLFPGLAHKKGWKMIKLDLKDAGLPYEVDGKFRDLHAVRHSFISNLWRTGANAELVRRLARHADLRMTVKYSHSSLDEQAAAIEKLPNVSSQQEEDD
ncbi:tyrosine-type recombinase/integrase [Symmachiella dynata]|uniref:tyrosine-type recombinase/integrase n=1 Tax=Symmachiella dynata TaxID=2527995 RepID=UPI0030EBBED4